MTKTSLILGTLLLGLVASSALADRGGNGNHYGWDKYGWDKHGWDKGGREGSVATTPEIDPGMIRGGLALVAGGLLVLRERRRRR